MRSSPDSINTNSCWIKSFFGFIGIFSVISGLYFLIISIMMKFASSEREIDQTKRNQKFCSQCGNELTEHANFCSNCGTPKTSPVSENILSSYKCPACGNPLPSLRIPSDKREALWGGWTCQVCNAKIDRYMNVLPDSEKGSAEKISPEDNSGKAIDLVYLLRICGGLIVALIIVITAINYWETLAKSTSRFLYGIVFLILLIGILYEGWKAVTH